MKYIFGTFLTYNLCYKKTLEQCGVALDYAQCAVQKGSPVVTGATGSEQSSILYYSQDILNIYT